MILMNEFTSEPAELKAKMLETVSDVIDSGWYILGNRLERLERDWADVCGTGHGIGVGNGLDAIEIILRTLDIKKGDEVITTSVTAFATVLAIIKSGATPVIADIDPGTGLMSIDSVTRLLNKRTKAIILVHLFGQIKYMENWVALCSNSNLYLIEDCAQSHLAKYNGRVAGSIGVAGAYSFYPTKNLGALGDAGMIVTSDKEIASMSRILRNYGQSERYFHPYLGVNSRLDEIQAAILTVRLEYLEQFTQQRRFIAQTYFERFSNPLIELLEKPEALENHVYHLFVIKTKYRERLKGFLADKNIQTHIHYPVPIHHQESLRGISIDPAGMGNSNLFTTECLSIPCHPQMTEEQLEYVITNLNAFNI